MVVSGVSGQGPKVVYVVGPVFVCDGHIVDGREGILTSEWAEEVDGQTTCVTCRRRVRRATEDEARAFREWRAVLK